MANNLQSNPLRVDTAATVISEECLIQAMEWVDDDAAAGGNVANGENLVMTLNGVTTGLNAVAAACQMYSMSLVQPIRCNSLIVSTIDGGTLFVWKA